MDTQAQRKDEEKKKVAPVLPNLLGGARTAGGLGGLGSGGSGGLAGLLARIGLGSGVLATKAGLVALIMAGTTVAGGLGYVGYRLFGPSDSDRVGASYSLFSPRPKDAASPAPTSGDSSAQPSSGSLDQLKAANGGGAGAASADQAAADKAAADKAAADKTAADKAAADKKAAEEAVAAAAKKAEGNKGNVMGNQAGKLKSDMRVGQLSKMPSAGAGGGGSSAIMAKAPEAKGSALAAFSSSPKTAGAAARAAMARMRGAGPVGQAQNALAQNQGAQTSYGAGGQYDGSAPAGINGAGAQPQGGGGAGTPGSGTNPSAPTAAAGGPSQFPTPPTPQGNNVTPWQHALDLAVGLIAIASLILMFGKMIANKMGGASPAIIYALAAIVAALGVGVMMLGKTIAGGQFGQTYQGGMFVAAGAALMVGAAAMMYSQATSSKGSDAVTDKVTGKVTPAQPPGILGNSMMNMIMMLSGASAMGLAMMSAMKPMAKYDQSAFPNGVPDLGYYSAPSSAAPHYVALGEAHGNDSRDS